jgi:ATP/ADP translocase
VPVTAGFQLQVADEEAVLFMHPAILFPFQEKVTKPAWLTVAVITIVVPLVAVVAEAVKAIVTDADADGVEATEFEASPSPRFETALISIW